MFYYKDEVLNLKGKDATTLLNNISTQNIKDLPSNQASYCCIVTPQAKLISDFLVYKISNEEILLHSSSQPNALIATINHYGLGSSYQLEQRPMDILVFGRSDQIVEAILKNAIIYKDPRHPSLGKVAITDSNHNTLDLLQKSGLVVLQWQDYLDYLANHGIVIGAILPPKKNILSYGFMDQNCISLNKGCYIGQETIMNTYTKGRINKSILRLKQISSTTIQTNFVTLARFDDIKNQESEHSQPETPIIITNLNSWSSIEQNNQSIGKIIYFNSKKTMGIIQISTNIKPNTILTLKNT